MAKKIPSAPSNLKSKISNPQYLRVLMVEDSEDDALLEISEMKKGGYNPVHERVETAAAMKKALKDKQWDIILCDYKLPQFSGTKAIALLKEINIDIPIIIVSGTIGEETAIECMRLGAHDYIMKGNLSRLIPAIERELKETESRVQRKQAEEALKESDKKYRLVVENAREAIIITQDVKLVFINRAAIDMIGYSEEILTSKLFTDFIHPDDLNMVVDHHIKRLKGEEVSTVYSFRVLSQDGTVKWCEINTAIIQWEGRPAGLNFLNNITERKQAEDALRQSGEKYRTILENMQEGYFEFDLIGNYTFVNDAECRNIGYPREELIGMNNRQYQDETNAQKMYQFFRRLFKTGEPVKAVDVEIIRKNGTKGFNEVSASLIRDAEGQPIGFRGISRDITERKRAEEKLRRSEEKYRSLVENAQEGIFQSTAGGRHISVNQAFANILGYESPEEVMATIADISHQVYVHPDDRTKILQIIEKEGSVKGYEAEFYKKDGSKTWMSINMHAIRDEEGRLLYYQGTDQDIIEKKNMETERQENIERLRKSLGVTINAISMIVEMKDPYTSGHQQRVSDLARSIATEMGLSADRQDFIRTASAIHDIGKISVPSEILSKPTKLTDLEFSLIKTHAQSGYDVLKDIEFPWPVADVILQHHERMDGSGYPQGLKGDDILLEARILAIADVVEAIASHRPYRPELGIDFALEEISVNKGILYDADAVDACLKLFREKGYTLVLKK